MFKNITIRKNFNLKKKNIHSKKNNLIKKGGTKKNNLIYLKIGVFLIIALIITGIRENKKKIKNNEKKLIENLSKISNFESFNFLRKNQVFENLYNDLKNDNEMMKNLDKIKCFKEAKEINFNSKKFLKNLEDYRNNLSDDTDIEKELFSQIECLYNFYNRIQSEK